MKTSLRNFGKELQEFIEKLRLVMANSPACVGIAAPQVNVHKRIILVDTWLV
jgi:peptide deformylase